MSRQADSRHGQASSRGVALIAVLWVVLLLAVIAGSLTMLTRTELGLSRNLVLSARAEALAEGGIYLAIDELLRALSTASGMPGTRRWQVEMEAGRLEIAAADVTGRIDLNAAPPELIAGLFEAAGEDPELAATLADRIVDWRDPDEVARPNGAEQADYQDRTPPVLVGNSPFLTADGILRVPGMTMDLWVRIADAVTVYSGQQGISPLYAPELAIIALPGMDAGGAKAVLEARGETPGEPAGPRQRIAEIVNLIPAEARRYLAGGSTGIYAVRAHGELFEGGIHVLDAVVEISPGSTPPWRVHEWRQGRIAE